MRHRIILFLVLVALVILIPISKWLRFPEQIGLCHGDFLCESFWTRGVFWPINESVYFIISSIALLIFFPFAYLKTWMKIMLPYAFIALFLIVMTPALCSGMICFDRTLIASGLSKIFLILTILILIIKSIYLFIISKRKSKK